MNQPQSAQKNEDEEDYVNVVVARTEMLHEDGWRTSDSVNMEVDRNQIVAGSRKRATSLCMKDLQEKVVQLEAKTQQLQERVAQAEKIIRLMTAQEKIAIMDTLGDAKEKNQIHRTHVRHTGAGGLYGSVHDSETHIGDTRWGDDQACNCGT